MSDKVSAADSWASLVTQIVVLLGPSGYALIEQWEDAKSINLTLHRAEKHLWVRIRKKSDQNRLSKNLCISAYSPPRAAWVKRRLQDIWQAPLP